MGLLQAASGATKYVSRVLTNCNYARRMGGAGLSVADFVRLKTQQRWRDEKFRQLGVRLLPTPPQRGGWGWTERVTANASH